MAILLSGQTTLNLLYGHAASSFMKNHSRMSWQNRAMFRKTDLSVNYKIAKPNSVIALTNARVITMNSKKDVLRSATVLIENDKIKAIGSNVSIPRGAKVYDLKGRTLMPGMFDAHGHYGSPISALNVIEQNLYGLKANLAYGVTTMYDVYGTTQKDFWVSDMLQAGKLDGSKDIFRWRSNLCHKISLEDAPHDR